MTRIRLISNRLQLLDTTTAPPPPRESTDPFYGSPEWKDFIRGVIKQRGRRCEGRLPNGMECGRTGCRIFGDHIVELQDGGARLDERNIQLLCGSCHTIKTNKERDKRRALGG